MVYKVIGLMSGSSLDGLDIAYVHLQERAASSRQQTRSWEFELKHTACYSYPENWRRRLADAPALSALDYQLLHVEYGHFLGEQVLRFIEEFGLHYNVQLIVSHGHTAFHWPARKMTAQLGDGAAIAARTGVNVVSDLRAMDLALGGQGAPIVPIGEELLLPGYDLFLNLGGIANVSRHGGAMVGGNAGRAAGGDNPGAAAGDKTGMASGDNSGATTGDNAGAAAGDKTGMATGDNSGVAAGGGGFLAFDVCPANRVLNALAELERMAYDDGGALAARGKVDYALLQQLNSLPYYTMPYPKSLANEFGTEVVYPLVRQAMTERGLSTADGLRTYVEHIALQVARAVEALGGGTRMLATGGGAHNTFLVERLRSRLGLEAVVPDERLVNYKEALIMALIGVLRWREENNVLASVTGASRDSIGGAVWMGQ